jgi:hypothetical protein
MSCKEGWDRRVLVQKFERVFVEKQYKTHREEILFEREKSLLPAAQPHAEREIHKEQIEEEIKTLNEQVKMLKKKMEDLNTWGTEKKQFVRKCPYRDCKGFLSTEWKCGLCENFTCSECNEIKGKTKDVQHTCDPNNVETVKLLEKDTKPCPGCGVGIFKVSGCSQMFCVDCHTVFDWGSGRIETGVIHNPHYFEYLSRTGNAERGNYPEFDNYNVREVVETLRRRKVKKAHVDRMMCLLGNIIHIRVVELQRFRFEVDNLDLRIKYMRDKLVEEEFRKRLQKREKKMQNNREIHNVLNMYINSVTDIVYRNIDNNTEMEEMFNEIDEIRNYTNDRLRNIEEVYKCRGYMICCNYALSE